MRRHHRAAEAADAADAIGDAEAGTRADRNGKDAAVTRGPGREEAIRVRAYYAWAAAGRPDGDGVEFWLRAEREHGVQDGEWNGRG